MKKLYSEKEPDTHAYADQEHNTTHPDGNLFFQVVCVGCVPFKVDSCRTYDGHNTTTNKKNLSEMAKDIRTGYKEHCD
jgi:hypothetical protein